jgi:sterol desaturase/sphingolipid hydroxylase (fatty acid hydroxylase superfamily)
MSKSSYALSKRAYYADFVLIPAGIGAAVVYLFMSYRVPLDIFASAILIGVIGWSLAEYLIHRFIFHRIEPLKHQHHLHHIAPVEYIGASSLATGAAFAGLLIGSVWLLGPVLGLGFAIGVAAGYYAYIALHDCFHHHKRLTPGSVVWRLYQNHEWHHRRVRANFGVSSPLWDILFHTYSAPVVRDRR